MTRYHRLVRVSLTLTKSMLYKYQFYPVVPDVRVELNITVSNNIDQNSIWSAGNSTNEAVDELSN